MNNNQHSWDLPTWEGETASLHPTSLQPLATCQERLLIGHIVSNNEEVWLTPLENKSKKSTEGNDFMWPFIKSVYLQNEIDLAGSESATKVDQSFTN